MYASPLLVKVVFNKSRTKLDFGEGNIEEKDIVLLDLQRLLKITANVELQNKADCIKTGGRGCNPPPLYCILLYTFCFSFRVKYLS